MKKFTSKSFSDITRRDFIERTAKSLLGVSILPTFGMSGNAMAQAAAAGGKAENCIFLYMAGGMTHIDTFDPKSGETAGPTKAINTKGDFQISKFLPKMAKQGDKFSIIRSMTSNTGVHFNGNYLMHTGYRPRATIKHPSFGPWAQELLGRRGETLPDSVVISAGSGHPGAGFMRAAMKPLPLRDPISGLPNIRARVDDERFDKRVEMSNQFDAGFRERYEHGEVDGYSDLYDETLRLMKSEDLAAFDLGKEKTGTRESYGMNNFGQGCLLAKRLIKRNVRTVEVQLNGWDMHNYIKEAITDQANILDTAVSALLADLKAEGLLEKTIVVICSEFGRTPRINMNAGRDHHPRVFSTMLAGGGIVGGQAYGSSDKKGYAVEDKEVTIQDFISTISHAMGMDHNRIIYSKSGRPFSVGGAENERGQPVTSLFG